MLRGLTTANATRENLARAAVEALLSSLADAVDHLGVAPQRILLIGGGARSEAVRRLAPGIFGVPVAVPGAGRDPEGEESQPAERGHESESEYVALGAARQAAWVLAQTPEPPAWPSLSTAGRAGDEKNYHGPITPGVRERYAALRDDTATWRNS
jgi:xylulokinase